MKCIKCGDGEFSDQGKCECLPDSPEKKIELLQRALYDAVKVLRFIGDMTCNKSTYSPQEFAINFLKEFDRG